MLQREVIQERVKDTLENLVPVNDREYDVFMKGMVHAFREVLEWEPQLEEDQEDDLSRDEFGEQGNP